jgi:hypothetical protein
MGHMNIDYSAHAVVLGTEPTETYSRGGKVAEGALGKMIAVALGGNTGSEFECERRSCCKKNE